MSEKNNNAQKTSDKSGGKFRKITEDPYFKSYLDQTLQIEDLRKKKKQTKLTDAEERRIKNNDDRKVRVLDNYIFGSMADLIYFFRFILRHPKLIDRFGEDIEELLRLKENNIGEAKFQGLGFSELVNLILNYPSQYRSDHEFSLYKCLDDSRFNFKRRLLPILQSIIYHHTITIMSQNKRDMLLKVKVDNEFLGVETWTKLIDKEPKHAHKPIRRKIIMSDIGVKRG